MRTAVARLAAIGMFASAAAMLATGARGWRVEAAGSESNVVISRLSSIFGLSLPPYGGAAGQQIDLGVFEPSVYRPGTTRFDFERSIGRDVGIVHVFQGWGAASGAVNHDLLNRVAARGSRTLITWEPWDYTKGQNQPEYRLREIAAGRYDAYATGWARELRSFGRPVYLRFAHEMNQAKYPWAVNVQGNTDQEYITAWRRLHAIFVREGATNVQWVWSPGVGWNEATDFVPMYPGDDVVDWLGLDVYNTEDWGGWRRFDQIAGPSYEQLIKLSAKPLMLAELGCSDTGGDKAAWIADAFERIPRQFPRIRAVVWFNEHADGQDWRIDTNQRAQLAMARSTAGSAYATVTPGREPLGERRR